MIKTDFFTPPNIPHNFLEMLKNASNVLILAHFNPDGDALGSCAALASTLQAQNKKTSVHIAGEYPQALSFVVENLNVVNALEKGIDEYDLFVLLDCHELERIGSDGALFAEKLASKKMLIVDHHLLAEGEHATDNWLHYTTASSTGELVYFLLRSLDWPLPPQAVEGALVAIVSDTGFFCQTNTTPLALFAASELVAQGGDIEDLNRRLKHAKSKEHFSLLGLALSEMKLYFDDRISVLKVDGPMLKKAGADMRDTEDFVEVGRSMAGVILSVLIKDTGLYIKVSLRSREPMNSAALAAHFGGGGHRLASAYIDKKATNVNEAEKNLLDIVERYL